MILSQVNAKKIAPTLRSELDTFVPVRCETELITYRQLGGVQFRHGQVRTYRVPLPELAQFFKRSLVVAVHSTHTIHHAVGYSVNFTSPFRYLAVIAAENVTEEQEKDQPPQRYEPRAVLRGVVNQVPQGGRQDQQVRHQLHVPATRNKPGDFRAVQHSLSRETDFVT